MASIEVGNQSNFDGSTLVRVIIQNNKELCFFEGSLVPVYISPVEVDES